MQPNSVFFYGIAWLEPHKVNFQRWDDGVDHLIGVDWHGP